MIPPLPRVRCDGTEPVHGGADPEELARLGLCPEQVLDFSANVNPFGPAPAVRRAVSEATLDRYPDRACGDLRRELARRHGVADDQVLVGNGSSELIWLAAIAYLAPGDRVLVLGPTFGEYEWSAQLMAAEVITCRATVEAAFRPPLDAFGDQLGECRPKLAFLANPNNPTGQIIPPERVRTLAARHPHTLFVSDEAYADCMVEPTEPIGDLPANVLRLRSLTKAHGLAGLRLGYAVGDRGVMTALRTAQPPWSVNALAQAAGLAALRDEVHRSGTVASWTRAAVELTDQLRAAGFAPVPADVPFFLLPVGDAARVRAMLLRQGLLVRDCTSFGLSEHVRISARTRADNARLVEALVAVRAEVARGPTDSGDRRGAERQE
jgi:threonine-phosphate decarboxylase